MSIVTSGPMRTPAPSVNLDLDAAVHASEERFRQLVEALKDYAIYMLDRDGRVSTWNAGAQAIKGYSADEIVGQHVSTFYSAEDRRLGKPEEELAIAARTGRFEEEGWRVRKDGTAFWANVLVRAIPDASGAVVGFAKVTRDLTERRNAQETSLHDSAERRRKGFEDVVARQKSRELEEENRRMHEANRLKSEFLANMSHELRTPLNAIIGFADLMFKGKVGPVSGDHKEYLGDILNSSRHLLKLINDVLDLAKVESGKMEFHPEAVDLGSVIAEVCDILRGLASTRRIRIETSVDPSIAAAVLDPSKLKQVLYNYLSNALKFSPEAGLVNISVFPEGQDGVRLEVEDRGIGIRPEDVHRLFVEFQQLDAGMAKRYAGTGLGLALTRRIIEAQGGATGVRSEPGRGSTFWAVLPRTAVGDRVTSISQAVPTTPVAIVPRTVLVVDDDPAALRLMGAMLKAAGHTGICFTDAKEALHALETMTPAAAVIDLSMPGMDGFALLNAFRALPAMHAVPVLVWTVQDLGAMERERLLVRAARIVLKGQGDSEAIIDALLPYLGVPLRGTPMPGEPILIVDDNVVNLKLARILLQGEGYDVRTAVTAEDALNLLSTFAPRLVLTDIQLPGMDGLELTRRLKADVATRDVVVLALTAYAMKGDEEKALAAGCDGYVTKPIDISGLPKVIAEHLMVLQGPH